MNLRVIIFFISVVMISAIYGQSDLGVITQISLEQGLSDRTIKDIAKDRYGYIWIATRNGLNRYDGLQIVNYDNHPRSQTRISFKDISKILCRKDGSVVIQYENNRRSLDVLGSASTQAQKLFLNRENGVLGQVEKLLLEKNTGELYALVTKDSSLIVQRMNKAHRFDSIFTLKGYVARPSSLYNFLMTERGMVWLSDNQTGLILSDTFGNIHSTFSYDSLGLTEEAGLANIFYQDRQGRVWLGFENAPGLWEFNDAAGYFTPFQLESEPGMYHKLWEDGLGNVMIATDSARLITELYIVSADDAVNTFDQLLNQEQIINVIFSDDFERLLFVGTTSGVKKITLTKKRVRRLLTANSNGSATHQGESIRGMVELPDSSVVIAGGGDRWYRFNARRDSMSLIDFQLPHDREVSYCDCSRQLVYDGEGGLWGTRFSSDFRAELIKMDISDSSFNSYYFPLKIQSLILGQDAMIWLVSGELDDENRLSSFDRHKKVFRHYFLPDGTNPLRDFRATYLFESADQTKWIGTTTGLIRISNEGEMKVFQFSDNYHGISSNVIHAIAEDSQHRIWVGTDGGVNIYDPNSTNEDEFIYYDTRDGLPDNNVCGIIEDANGNMWLSTLNGLSYFDLSLRSFRNFGAVDGFSHVEFNPYSFYKDHHGNILMGGINGLNYFNPNELLERNLDAPILLSELSYYDKIEGAIVENLHNLQEIKEVVLPASNRYFHCAFALADYAYPQLNQYQYKLEGLDIEWNSIGTQNEIRFNNLPAGSYVLKIRGTDRNLNVSSKEFALVLRVNQYFYKKAWFIALCIVVVLLAIYLFHHIRLRQVIEMERLRTKISSDLHDDVGGLLSGLAMQTELLEYTAAESDKPKLKRISDMSRNAMAQMRDVIWATDARKDRFEDLLVRMKEYAAEILFSRNITCNFHVKGILPEKKLPVQVRQNLYLIFKEAITNVAKHSNASRADVYLIREGSQFQMVISDDGTEISENGHTSSLNGAGLKNMEMRAENINATFSINRDKGFTVTVEMKAMV
jgi:signal transduction histidine kinase/ligand-binding sensor domain-containing protein